MKKNLGDIEGSPRVSNISDLGEKRNEKCKQSKEI